MQYLTIGLSSLSLDYKTRDAGMIGGGRMLQLHKSTYNWNAIPSSIEKKKKLKKSMSSHHSASVILTENAPELETNLHHIRGFQSTFA